MLSSQREPRRASVLFWNLTRVIWPPCFAVSWAVNQEKHVCVTVHGSAQLQSGIALGLNKCCTTDHVAQLTAFTGPITGSMENSRPVYTTQRKTRPVISGFTLRQLKCGWARFFFSQRRNFVPTCRNPTAETEAADKTQLWSRCL